MYNKILIRYGELVLKGDNRKLFTRQLKDNIEAILKTEVDAQYDRMFINYDGSYLEKLIHIPGISTISPVLKVEKNLDEVKEILEKIIDPSYKTFKVSARRNDKTFEFSSDEINRNLGSYIIQNFNLKVDLHNPVLNLIIEVRKDGIYIIDKIINGLSGLPVSVSGKVIHLLSGGFDSPVAAIDLMKRGVKVIFLAFITPPHTDENTVAKLRDLMKVFTKYQGRSKIYITEYTDLMNYIGLTSDQSYKITLMRRSFMRLANKLARNEKALAISTGENLAQVASQTLESLNTIASESNLEIIRPLITENKNDIINRSKKYLTHDISIKQCSESCELFAPKQPVIRPNITRAKQLEDELNEINEFEKKVISSFKAEFFEVE
ncbi:tRNA 4-thiouridine(8) synthase ThiI [Mycoplasmopsis agassizii]|uniref:Probable tRNA sulfurtransferase n=1 Tax=Mycoplasmopsis agassizii TaxID=33922 RepID=A0A269TJ29_9BACT|nr:tRNA uracil 4-sulfurtransferase ThiI [Mycoplasmopsis agassizii]PAK21469.1 tRNA 4-thiouridine(8) synthase ThiI [Mycoplasmopsis agassizii]